MVIENGKPVGAKIETPVYADAVKTENISDKSDPLVEKEVISEKTVLVPVGKPGKKDIIKEANKEYVEKYILNAVDKKIAELIDILNTGLKSDEDKAKVEQRLGILNELKSNRDATASYRVSEDGKSVVFTMKTDVPAEVFKELFFIEDGALREQLKSEYDNNEDNGVFEKTKYVLGFIPVNVVDYEAAILFNGKEYTVSVDKLKEAGDLNKALSDYVDHKVKKEEELNH